MSGNALSIGVVGAGTMGAGVAESLARAGHDVTVVDSDQQAVEQARSRMRDSLRLAILLGRAGGPKPAEVTARVHWTGQLTDLCDVAVVIECVPERIDLKEKIFAELDRVCAPDALLASCTSGIPVDRLAASTTRPEQVVGLHFMNRHRSRTPSRWCGARGRRRSRWTVRWLSSPHWERPASSSATAPDSC